MNTNKIRQSFLNRLLVNGVNNTHARSIVFSFLGRFSEFGWYSNRRKMSQIMKKVGTSMLETADEILK